MANFEAKSFKLSEINNGVRYENGNVVDAEAINKPIEASAFAQQIAQEAQVASQQALDKINDSVHGSISLSAYPIGSIYLSISDTSPALLFGGTWEKIKNKFLVGAGEEYSIGTQGGSSYHTHGLTQAYAKTAFIGGQGAAIIGSYVNRGDTYSYDAQKYVFGTSATSSPTNYYTELDGYTDEATNIPPYLTVNMWKRIS